VVLGTLTGCITTPVASPDWPEPEEPRVVLLPGDSVEIEFAFHPELNSTQTIRPDGKISLQLIDEVLAAGLEPAELRQVLHDSYQPNLRNPEINVVVASFESSRVYVGGEVLAPGVYPMRGGSLSALEAVMMAGGFQPRSARMSEVVVIRRRGGEQYARTIDLRSTIESPESEPFYLEPLDVVFIPRTRIDHVNQWVDQYINNIVPRNVQMSFWYDVRGPQRQSGPTQTLSTTITPGVQFP
jgi:protein involved in polysaccharide export with SLBB domain